MPLKQTFGMTRSKALSLISKGKLHDVLETFIKKFKTLEKEYDFVFVKGLTRSKFTHTIDDDINLLIAKNLGIPFISVLNGHGKDVEAIYDELSIEAQTIKKEGCKHFATFINRVDERIMNEVSKKVLEKENKFDTFVLPEIKRLDSPTIEQVKNELDCEVIFANEENLKVIIGSSKIAAMTVENFLARLEDKDLVIVPGDRNELVLASLLSIHSKNSPKIAGLLLTGGMKPTKTVQNILEGLKKVTIPILSTPHDTYETAMKVSQTKAIMTPQTTSQIALALGAFAKAVDIDKITKNIEISSSHIMTPVMFEYGLFQKAKENKKTIVLPEAHDERILKAAQILLFRDIVDIVLLGEEEHIVHKANMLGLDISKAKIIDITKSSYEKKLSSALYEARKHKGMTQEVAHDLIVSDYTVFGTMMVHTGLAHGMVSGAVNSTADTVRPALQIIKTRKDTSIVSSAFFMCLDTKVLVYADCALNQDPNAKELAQIAISSAKTASSFGIVPRVAMLSYSTGDSGSGADVDKVKEATRLVKELEPDLLVEGPIQYDAAVDMSVAKKKLPNSPVAGNANVFIFPDLNTGNNTYKAVQRSSQALAIGPVLQGLNKPINDLSRGCLVEDIVNTVAITAIQAQG
jgi:phosphate acetyltransferase